MLSAALSLLVLSVVVLAAGAVALWRRGERRRPALMLVLALVAALNVAIWTVPDRGGEAPFGRELG